MSVKTVIWISLIIWWFLKMSCKETSCKVVSCTWWALPGLPSYIMYYKQHMLRWEGFVKFPDFECSCTHTLLPTISLHANDITASNKCWGEKTRVACTYEVASSPGHSQILSPTACEIKSGSGLGMRLPMKYQLLWSSYHLISLLLHQLCQSLIYTTPGFL